MKPISLTQEVQKSIAESVLCWLATTNAQGCPSVSPKEIFCSFGDQELIIANIASPNSLANIAANPQVCLSVLHIFKQKGFKIYGQAQYSTKDTAEDSIGYEQRYRKLRALAGEGYPIGGIIRVAPSAVAVLQAPSYRLFPEMSEEERVLAARRTYGV